LLPKDALAGKLLALSVSQCPDVGRLGLLDSHLRLVLGEVTRTLVLAGGQLGYGGHLEPSGYTAFLVNELYRYSRRDEPVKVVLAWDNHSSMSSEELVETIRKYSLHAEVMVLSPAGNRITLEERHTLLETGKVEGDPREWLTGMRRYLTSMSDAHFLIGGTRSNYSGRYPGVVEEALMALQAGRPIYPAAGFGGATYDIAKTIYSGLVEFDLPYTSSDSGLETGLEEIRLVLERAGPPVETGLSSDEMRRLMSSYRPSEIASLVGLGMGRRQQAKS